MGRYVVKPRLRVNGVDMSKWVAGCFWSEFWELRDTTRPGTAARTRRAFLQDGSVSIDWVQDFDPEAVFRTLHPLGGQVVPVEMKPFDGPARASNPVHTAMCVISEVPVLSGRVGELATDQTLWQFTGVPVYSSATFETTMTVGRSGSAYGFNARVGGGVYGAIADNSVTAGSVTVVLESLTWTLGANLRFFRLTLEDNAQAVALLGWHLEAGPLEMELSPAPTSPLNYYQTVTDNPQWSDGQMVRVALWAP